MPSEERPAALKSGSKKSWPYPARWTVLFALAFGALVIIGVALDLTAERRTLARAKRAAESGSPVERRLAVKKLEALGDAGVPLLLVFALDETSVPLEVEEGAEHAALALPDSVCDEALDALRRSRKGPDAWRTFSWEAASGKSYAQALHEYRRAELDKAYEWWKTRSGERATLGGEDQ